MVCLRRVYPTSLIFDRVSPRRIPRETPSKTKLGTFRLHHLGRLIHPFRRIARWVTRRCSLHRFKQILVVRRGSDFNMRYSHLFSTGITTGLCYSAVVFNDFYCMHRTAPMHKSVLGGLMRFHVPVETLIFRRKDGNLVFCMYSCVGLIRNANATIALTMTSYPAALKNDGRLSPCMKQEIAHWC